MARLINLLTENNASDVFLMAVRKAARSGDYHSTLTAIANLLRNRVAVQKLDLIAQLRAIELKTGGEGLRHVIAYRSDIEDDLMKEVSQTYGPQTFAAVKKSMP